MQPKVRLSEMDEWQVKKSGGETALPNAQRELLPSILCVLAHLLSGIRCWLGLSIGEARRTAAGCEHDQAGK
jgi:hypothetical protein